MNKNTIKQTLIKNIRPISLIAVICAFGLFVSLNTNHYSYNAPIFNDNTNNEKTNTNNIDKNNESSQKLLLSEKETTNKNTNNIEDKKTNATISKIVTETPSDIMCTQVITEVYLKDGYYYTAPNGCGIIYIKVIFSDGTKLSLKEALDTNKITIEDLIKYGFPVHKKTNATISKIVTETPSDIMCTQVITEVYLKDGYYYTAPNGCGITYIKVIFSDGTKLSLKEALDTNKITINDLIKYGFPVHKGKYSIDIEL